MQPMPIECLRSIKHWVNREYQEPDAYRMLQQNKCR